MPRRSRIMRMGLSGRILIDFGSSDQRRDSELLNDRQHGASDKAGNEADDKNPR